MKFLVLSYFFTFVILQFYYWYFFSAFSFHSKKEKRTKLKKPVSVVICAKNEADHLLENIPLIAHQNFHEFEIILVDDHSNDNTYQVMMQLKKSYSKIKVIDSTLVKERKGKKQALATGVANSSFEIILVTDADCAPVSKNWISLMTAPFVDEHIDLVLGLSPNKKQTGFWIGFFRFETFMTALHYVSFSLRGLPYMGVGRNMAYRKKFFQKFFPPILKDHHFSGDDDLLVNAGASKRNTTVVMNQAAFTISDSPQTLKSWWKQKQRHLSVGGNYKLVHQILLALFPLFLFLFMINSIILLFSPIGLLILMMMLCLYLTISVINSIGLKRFHATDLCLEAPLYFLIWFVLIPVISIFSKFKKINNWN